MIIDYKKLSLSIYNSILANPEALNIDFNNSKNSHIHQDIIVKIASDIFNHELKEPFESTIFNLGGHHLCHFDNMTVSQILDRNPENKLISDIKLKIISQLENLVKKFSFKIKNNETINEIEDDLINNKYYFSRFSVINNDYCLTCGKRSDYYIIDGIISHKSLKETSYWDNLDDHDKLMIEKDYNNEECPLPLGIDKYEFTYEIKSGQLLVANSLTDIFDVEPSQVDNYIHDYCGYYNDINSELGVKANQSFWNDKGLIYIQSDHRNVVIMKDSINESLIGIKDHLVNEVIKFPIDTSNMKKIVSSIDTQCWCIHLIDMEYVRDYAKNKNMKVKDVVNKFRGKIIDVKPGKYKVICYNAHNYYNRPIFFSIEKVY